MEIVLLQRRPPTSIWAIVNLLQNDLHYNFFCLLEDNHGSRMFLQFAHAAVDSL